MAKQTAKTNGATAPLTAACPQCGAAAGAGCHTASGNPATKPHAARQKAAAVAAEKAAAPKGARTFRVAAVEGKRKGSVGHVAVRADGSLNARDHARYGVERVDTYRVVTAPTGKWSEASAAFRAGEGELFHATA